jgi:hypothetical protein
MKKVAQLMVLLNLFSLPTIVFAQTFQNFDFESADVSTVVGYKQVQFANAFPGWSGSTQTPYFGFSSMASYNYAQMDDMFIGIFDQNGPYPSLDGYTAYLGGDLSTPYVNYGSADIWQTGVIPANAKSIQFYSTIAYEEAMPGYSPTLTLSLNGTPVSFSAIGTLGAFTQYAADVSAYAGTSTTLKFDVSATYPSPAPVSPNRHWIFGVGIDQISFSPTPAPEPAAITLLSLGLVFFIFNLSRKQTC